MKVVIAMSGGVDSSVAAARLVAAGHECVGLFMRHGATAPQAPGRARGCCSVEDAGDARRVAARLDIPFYALDFEAEFSAIIDEFATTAQAARTSSVSVSG